MNGFADISVMEMERVDGGLNVLQVAIGVLEVVGAAYITSSTAGLAGFVMMSVVTSGAANIAQGLWGN